MTEVLRADVLARLLLTQAGAGQLAEASAIIEFVCRGLSRMPGVAEARHVGVATPKGGREEQEAGLQSFPVCLGTQCHGEIVLRVADRSEFLPYAPHVKDLVNMVAVILEERRLRRLGESHAREIEACVGERTRELSAEVLVRREAEAAALAEKRRAERYLEVAEAIIVELDWEGRVTVINKRGSDLLGWALAEVLGRSWFELAVAGEDRTAVRASFDTVARAELGTEAYHDGDLLTRSGERRHLAWHATIRCDDQGKPVGFLVSGVDITDRKRAEDEQAGLQMQLVQAHKLESVGRLAGGVAHEFNNMLHAILGNVELVMRQVPAGGQVHADLLEIQRAAERSAALTRQLLAFGRKQAVSPRVLDLNDTVSGMLRMLRRLIGEDIQLAWLPGPGLWPVRMDPAQVDQLLVNLVGNARDAIDGAGDLIIETVNLTLDGTYARTHADCQPGQYVMLAVSDTGAGMDRETRTHLFEPFFTTKAAGAGFGLGLATVHGMVRQNGGFISVYGEPGQGATFKIYLPRVQAPAESEALATARESPRGTETVLLVDDEELILGVGQRILREHGYTVQVANSPEQAIQLAGQHAGPIHLLITDVVMPGLNGPDLQKRVAALQPGLRCIFMSGYTSNVIARHGLLEEGVHFLSKPFTTLDLTGKVRDVLDA